MRSAGCADCVDELRSGAAGRPESPRRRASWPWSSLSHQRGTLMNCYCVLVDGSAAAILGRVRGPGRLRAPVKLGASGLPFRRPRTLRENTLPTVEKALVIAG